MNRNLAFQDTPASGAWIVAHNDSAPRTTSIPSLILPVQKPTRPLSAYNLFFQKERVRILELLPERKGEKPKNSHGKLGFREMATIIGKRWRELNDTQRAPFVEQANKEKSRHQKALARYRKYMKAVDQRRKEENSLEPLPLDDTIAVGDAGIDHLAGKLDKDMIHFIVSKFK